MRTPFGSPVLDAACRLMVPFIMLFAVYVLVHGHDSPGGGFQAGAILAAILILIRMVHGEDAGWGLASVRRSERDQNSAGITSRACRPLGVSMDLRAWTSGPFSAS